MNSGVCVSTVSSVCGRESESMAAVAGCIYWPGRLSARPKVVIIVADAADGADGIFGRRTDPDHPGSSSAFASEGNNDTQCPKEWLRTTQAASEGPRGLRLIGGGPAREAGIRQIGAGAQEIRSISRPRAAGRHNLPYPSGYWINVDQVLDRGSSVCLIRARERATRPQRRFACRGPQREVCHPGKLFQVDSRHVAQAARRSVEQRSQDTRSRDLEVTPKLPFGASATVGDGWQGQEKGAIGEVGPANDVLDAIEKNRPRGLK
jgi:hypothetical protein